MDGYVKFIDLKENVTYREELDETTVRRQRTIIETRDKTLNPHIHVIDEDGKKLGNFLIPVKSTN